MPSMVQTQNAVPDWRHRAACLDVDPELFFPIGNTGPALAQIEQAKAVCHDCPVNAHCRQWAFTTRQPDGVWGGLSVEERLSELRRRARGRASRTAGAGVVAA
jgi:WhiB family redox-sensing transcriptional regulator